jgi:selenide,water dikinase
MLSTLKQATDDNLLVGFNTSDDAGVYRLTDDLAIVTTADFITPPVNNPYQFGQIAAANAISDVYAMGGEPKVCLNLVCFPYNKLPAEDLNQIVTGAVSIITEAGAILAGGHSVEDDEPKFGLSVVGVVHPKKIWTNTGARPGDVLVLTKPLGSGVLFNANLKKWVSEEALEACVQILTALNRDAAHAMKAFDIHAATDVTGFGLAGHAMEMAKGSNTTLEIDVAHLPIMDQALDMYRRGMTTGVNGANRKLVEAKMSLRTSVPDWHQEILFDPQTSGGLLVALPEDQGRSLVAKLASRNTPAAHIIGRVMPLSGPTHLIFK